MGGRLSKRSEVQRVVDFEGMNLSEFPGELLEAVSKLPSSKRKPARQVSLRLNFNQLTCDELNSHLCGLALLADRRCLAIGGMLLSDNVLSSVPWSLQSFRHLDTLYLHRNDIAELPLWFAACLGHSLRVLTLAENPVERLPANFELMQRLEELYISDTKIARLPYQLLRLSALRLLVYEPPSGTADTGDEPAARYDWQADRLSARCIQTLVASSTAAALPDPAPAQRWRAEQLAARALLQRGVDCSHRLAQLAQATLPSTGHSVEADVVQCARDCPRRCDRCQRLSFNADLTKPVVATLFGVTVALQAHFCSPHCAQ